MKLLRVLIITLLVGLLIGNLYFLVGGEWINWDWLLEKMSVLAEISEDYFWSAVILFLGVRFFFSVVSVPGSGVLTTAGGAIFGLWAGTLLTLIAVMSGLSVAFILTRYGWLQLGPARAGDKSERPEKSYAAAGAGLLMILRLTNLAPAFMINSGFAVTRMKFSTYFFISLPSVLPGIMLFSAFGHGLGEVMSSPVQPRSVILLALAAAGLFSIVFAGWKLEVVRKGFCGAHKFESGCAFHGQLD